MATWYCETLYPGVAQRLRIDKVVFQERTANHEIVIFENCRMGRVLTLDGVLQTTEADEYVYHEMIAHVPIIAHGAARKVLIIGGGDGGSLRRCLMHGLDSVTLVEVDRTVIECCKLHIPSIGAGAFDDARCDLVIDDGAAFVANTDQIYDVIIIDSTDPIGPGEVLFTQEFYARCKGRLAPGGVLVTQNGVPFLQAEELRGAHARLRPLFADVTFYIAAIPTYYGGYMTFGWATDNVDLRRQPVDQIRNRFETTGLETRFYTPEIHVGSFNLPPFVAEILC